MIKLKLILLLFILPMFAFGQQLSVKGKVTEGGNSPLPGVTVVLVGTTNGTITDANGDYSLNVENKEGVLKFSFTGYEPQQISVDGNKIINVHLKQNLKQLDEVVVVGYGTQKKVSSTAAVSTLRTAEIASLPVVNISNDFVGRVAGVIANQGSGEPGNDGSTLRIRGTGTTGSKDPLVVVDGIIRGDGYSRLDPNSIESFTFLKDAAAVAPYGLAGANGVILVTTKKGKTGAPTLSYNGYVGVQNPTRLPHMVNSYQYALLMNEAAINSGLLNMPFSAAEIAQYKKTVARTQDADPDKYPNSSGLRDVLQKNSLITSHNIQLSGGTDRVKYYTSLGYTSQQGQFATTSLNKYNAMVNLDIKATSTTAVSISMNGWVEDQNYSGKTSSGDYASANGGILYQAFRTPPTSAIYYSNGLWGSYIGRSLVGYINHSGYVFNENTQMMSTFSVEQQLPFIKGLSIKGAVSYDPYNSYSKIWQTPVLSYNVDYSTRPYTFSPAYTELSQPSLNESTSQNKTFTYQGYINYHNTFGKNDITFLAVMEARNEKYWNLSASRINYPIIIDEINQGGTADGEISNGGNSSEQKQIGYVYRIGYSYDGKYMAEMSGRYDGHYYFAPGHRWGFFPAFSLGWNIAKEDFIQNNFHWIDALKLRTSYGESGNLAGGAFQYLSGYGIYSNAAYFNGKTTGVYETTQGNPNITWERAKKFDVGLESILWNGLFRMEADYFYEKRSNMLMTPSVTVPLEYGIDLSQVNAGIMSNHGIEVSLGTAHTFANGLRLEVNGTYSFAENTLLKVYETEATYNNLNTRRTGRASGTQFGLKCLGFFAATDFNVNGSLKKGVASIPDADVHPGDLKYADLNGDGIIDYNDETVIGKPNGSPQMIFGLNPKLSWKGFDFGCLIQGASQISLPVGGSLVMPFDQQGSASELLYNNHWTPNNPNALYPRVTSQPTDNNTRYSSWWVRDATYLKLRNAELGYTLPASVVKSLSIHNLRVFVSGQNLVTWTPFMKEMIDPEAASSNGQYYYQQQVFSCGLNVTF